MVLRRRAHAWAALIGLFALLAISVAMSHRVLEFVVR
jgi:hypothetical protein